MEKLPKNLRAEKICFEWAADFEQRGESNDAGFWCGIGLAFSSGAEINQDAFEMLIEQISSRAEWEAMIAKSMSAGDCEKTRKIQDALLEISREAEFLKKVLDRK